MSPALDAAHLCNGLWHLPWAAAAYALFAGSLLVLSVIDVRSHRLPRRIVLPVMGGSVALFGADATSCGDARPLLRAVACAVGAGLAFLSLHVVSPRGMGFGDVRLAALIGLELGRLGVGVAVVGLALGTTTAAAFGAVAVASGARSRRDAIPLGPFLAAGALVAMVAARVVLTR